MANPSPTTKSAMRKSGYERKVAGRPKEGAAAGRNDQAKNDAVFVSEPGDGIAENGGDGEVKERADEVGAEESELHQHGVEVNRG